MVSWQLIAAAPATRGYELALRGASGAPVTWLGTDYAADEEIPAARYFIRGESGRAQWDATAGRWRICALCDGRIASHAILVSDSTDAWNSNQSVGIDWTATIRDVGGCTDLAGNQFVARRAGMYRSDIYALSTLTTPASTSPANMGAFLRETGDAALVSIFGAANFSNRLGLHESATYERQPGEVLYWQVAQYSGRNLTFSGLTTTMQMHVMELIR
jgi:hypothetical protein